MTTLHLSLSILVLTGVGGARAATTILYEPSPYLGAFDSPFYTGIQAGTIYLEDFEDHALNTPFVIANDFNVNPANGWVSTTVRTGDPLTPRANSVDVDDGLFGDFKGFAGDALTNELPPSGNGQFYVHEFLFTPDPMGRYPTYVGFVVTDPEDIDRDVIVRMDDATGDNIVGLDEIHFDPRDWTGGEFNGDTRRHRFIGAYSSDGIAFLQITGVDELDHLQYGYAIPEPAAGALGLLALAFLALRRKRR